MALILNIDTATGQASVALSKEEKILHLLKNPDLQDHAAWIHEAINGLMNATGYTLNALDAVAVTAGPGSYTGLRVGMATAKGICYSLNLPLITESTLKVMAGSAMSASKNIAKDPAILLVPMIDARRMEVFTAVYDQQLNEIVKPVAMILQDDSFLEIEAKLLFFGSGQAKFRTLIKKENVLFEELEHDASSLAALAYAKFLAKEFSDVAYAEPVYLKEFYTYTRK